MEQLAFMVAPIAVLIGFYSPLHRPMEHDAR